MDKNQITLIGHLGTEILVKNIEKDGSEPRPVASFRFAVNSPFDSAAWFSIECWDSLSEVVKKLILHKGSRLYIEGKPVPANLASKKGMYTINTPVGDMTDSFIGRILHNYMGKQISKMISGQEGTPTALLMEVMADEAPMRSILMAGDGAITRPMLDAMLVMINGHFFKGAAALVKVARRK